MRTVSSKSSKVSRGPPSEKLFVNSNTLCVIGERIAVNKVGGARVTAPKHRNIEIFAGSGDGDEEDVISPQVDDRRQDGKNKRVTPAIIHPKPCIPQTSDICNRQLRKIRETVEAADFERLLRGLTGAPEGRHVRKSPAVTCLDDLNDIYHEFFGVHYDHLRDFVKRRSKMPPTT